jgi:hypothetical protein
LVDTYEVDVEQSLSEGDPKMATTTYGLWEALKIEGVDDHL